MRFGHRQVASLFSFSISLGADRLENGRPGPPKIGRAEPCSAAGLPQNEPGLHRATKRRSDDRVPCAWGTGVSLTYINTVGVVASILHCEMALKNDSPPPRCPKCNAPMTPVEDRPRFAHFLPVCNTFKCDRCQIALSHSDDDDEQAAKAVE